MTKNKTTETTETTENTAPAREKRMSLTNIAPSAVNGWTGSVTATIAENGETVVFEFVTPELSDRDARAIAAGYAARLSIAASGKKTAADIRKALEDEILVLTAGTYTVRGGNGVQSSFTDTIISLGLLRRFSEVDQVKCNFSQEQYDAILADNAFLLTVQADWDAADDAGKKALTTPAVVKTKRLVGFYKV